MTAYLTDGRKVHVFVEHAIGSLQKPMTDAMRHAHYPLQALLYSVALHRFLRWRQPGYSPEAHLGGVLYLFLRGMCGPETPVADGMPCGVFSWAPPAGLVTDLRLGLADQVAELLGEDAVPAVEGSSELLGTPARTEKGGHRGRPVTGARCLPAAVTIPNEECEREVTARTACACRCSPAR